MEFLEKLKKKAQAKKVTIVLPESKDDRILKATSIILQEKIANIILLGNPDEIQANAKSLSLDLSKAAMVDPLTDAEAPKYINHYFEKRKHKGMTEAAAHGLLTTNYLFYGAMMVDEGVADGMVAGAISPTADTFRAALHCVGIKAGCSCISSFFMMLLPDGSKIGEQGMFFMADCGVVPHPDAEQLSDIAVETASSFWNLTGIEPKVAFLSFSTKGSSTDHSIDKIRSALAKAKEKNPTLIIDGEMQVDTALIPEVAQRKDPKGVIGGKANVLIFPNLESGNISYKLVERTAKAEAIGPIFQGVRKPVNDLSRGSTIDDIVGTVIITALMK